MSQVAIPRHVTERLIQRRPPKSPERVTAKGVDDMFPYLEAVARRPYSTGNHVTWDLHEGERVLLRVDNWYDDEVVEAVCKVLEEFGCTFEVRRDDLGPSPQHLEGHDEIEVFLGMTKETARELVEWRRLDREGRYDKLLWGLGGPLLADSALKIQRMPFLTPEHVMSSAHTLPFELLRAIDGWTHQRCLGARSVHIVDPEGTDLKYENSDELFSPDRTQYSPKLLDDWWGPDILPMLVIPHGGHIFAKPPFLTLGDNADGVMAGTMNHIGPYPHIRIQMKGSKVVGIDGGGRFGEKLTRLMEQTNDLQYPQHPDKGLLYLWEVAVGTNPKIHRPGRGYLTGHNCAIYERVRSGIIHLGFGSVMSSRSENEAAEAGMLVGHFHVHLYFPTVTLEMSDGSKVILIEDGHLKALDDPAVRNVAAKYGDPDVLLSEDWVPAIPGLNMDGDYETYANDPLAWMKVELALSENWRDLYTKLVSPSGGPTAGPSLS
jgi:hypothetical protein